MNTIELTRNKAPYMPENAPNTSDSALTVTPSILLAAWWTFPGDSV